MNKTVTVDMYIQRVTREYTLFVGQKQVVENAWCPRNKGAETGDEMSVTTPLSTRELESMDG